MQHLDPCADDFIFFSIEVMDVVGEKHDLQKVAIESRIKEPLILKLVGNLLGEYVRVRLILPHHQLFEVDEELAEAITHPLLFLGLGTACVRTLIVYYGSKIYILFSPTSFQVK